VTQIGVVAIGRNEGERLRKCLASVLGAQRAVVYVDSGSTDDSVGWARSQGADVVELDRAIPFTAARARNVGLERLAALAPGSDYVQFTDGDCEVIQGWIERAESELESNPKLAVVCGRRRERFPETSIYNRLCDMEWNTPVGPAKMCGGDALMRVSALREVGGFDPGLIAGEEPELCVRLRKRGWNILRIEAEMTLHDAAMTRFGQWWRRNIRAGHASAEGASMHGKPPERHMVRETRSNWFWGALVPILALGPVWPSRGWSGVLLLGYGILFWRIVRSVKKRGFSNRDARAYAIFGTMGKFPQMIGQLKFVLGRILGRRSRLIEYKVHCL
jgi:GT2 family glycosyltransferase